MSSCYEFTQSKILNSSINVPDTHAILLVLSATFLFVRARRQYQLRSVSDVFMDVTNPVLFPVHLWYLVVLAIALLIDAFSYEISGNMPFMSSSKYKIYLFGNLGTVAASAVLNAITALLVSPTIGVRALRFSGAIGGLTIIITTSLVVTESLKTYIVYRACIIGVYIYVLHAPEKWFRPRRKAAIVWLQFVVVFRIFQCLGFALSTYHIDAGYCVTAITDYVWLDIRACWVAFSVFAMEARWWYGVADCDEGHWCKDGVYQWHFLCGIPFCDILLLKEINLRKELLEPRYSLTLSDQASITTPLAGLILSQEAANEMSIAVGGDDGLRPAAPLLDFTRLKILGSKLLGQGSSAKVFEGRLNGKRCAVKLLMTPDISAEDIKRACEEAALLSSLSGVSEHIVGFFGIAVQPPSLCVVLELCSDGSLSDILYRTSTAPDGTFKFAYDLTSINKLDLALGACSGLEAMCAALPGYSHNDIKSANFLVSRGDTSKLSYCAKIADLEFATFGVTPLHLKDLDNPNGVNWTAPEVMSGDQTVSPASDIFSLACVLYEIIERRVPLADTPDRDVARYVISGGRAAFSPSSESTPTPTSVLLRLMRPIIEEAWAQPRELRPSAATLRVEIEELRAGQIARRQE